MRRSRATIEDLRTLRSALAAFQPGSAHQANKPPRPEDIYTPRHHANALDPQRTLVVGNRGVGKSFWSSVLIDIDARQRAAAAYPRIPLAKVQAKLGFYEAAGKDESQPAPSAEVLSELMRRGRKPEDIWRGVLMVSLRNEVREDLPKRLSDVLDWVQSDVERAEGALRNADELFHSQEKIFVLVFDALDRLAATWHDVTALSSGMLRFALDMRGFRALRAKVFMRADQANDDSLFHFPDASKIKSDSVRLVWDQTELFGLLYNYLSQKKDTRDSLIRLSGSDSGDDIFERLKEDTEVQEFLFYRLAGEFMGAGPKRGRTYTWLYDHLSDSFRETSPRSFITALARAATVGSMPKDTSIDYNGIRAGVQAASQVRVDELKEDYAWINIVFGPLRGLAVPCERNFFIRRWRERGTVAALRALDGDEPMKLPLQLAHKSSSPENALLNALQYIGVIEERSDDRINMPDIFRVEASIKRRGGVRPPSFRNR